MVQKVGEVGEEIAGVFLQTIGWDTGSTAALLLASDPRHYNKARRRTRDSRRGFPYSTAVATS